MSEAFSSVLALAVITAVSVLLLKNLGSSTYPVVLCLGGVAVLSLVMSSASLIGGEILKISDMADIGEYAEAALKIIGVGYLSGISSDICEGLGEAKCGSWICLAGKLEIMLIALPYFLDVLSLGMSKL